MRIVKYLNPRHVVSVLSVFLSLLTINVGSSYADEPTYTISGIMIHTDLEGGCWYVDATDGQHYELVGDSNLINRLHEQGKKVDLLVRNAVGRASICMVGTIVEVIDQVGPPRHPVDLAIEPMKLNGRMHYRNGMWYVRTKEGAQYEFKYAPAKKYRKENARINTTMRVLLDKNSTKLHVDGVVLPPPRPPIHSPGKNIPKKYDDR